MRFLTIGITLMFLSIGLSAQGQSTEDILKRHPYALSLNAGSKWKVDKDMMVVLRRMEQRIKGQEKVKERDYTSLGDALSKDINALVAGCTMSGPAHDALHKWLVPYMDLVGELKDSPNDYLKEESYRNLLAAFRVFNVYFE